MKIDYEERQCKPDHIAYYYDRHQRLWIIQVIADDGYEYQDGDYEYRAHEYHRSVRDYILEQWQKEYNCKAIKLK